MLENGKRLHMLAHVYLINWQLSIYLLAVSLYPYVYMYILVYFFVNFLVYSCCLSMMLKIPQITASNSFFLGNGNYLEFPSFPFLPVTHRQLLM